MAKFIDYHAKMPQVPTEAIEQMRSDMREQRSNEFGVTPVNLLMGAGGEAWCLCEAPNADAVIKAHEVMGVSFTPTEVIEVTSLV